MIPPSPVLLPQTPPDSPLSDQLGHDFGSYDSFTVASLEATMQMN